METIRTILVAEDNESEALLLKHAFVAAGIIINLAMVSDGKEAVGYLSGDNPYRDRILHPIPALVLLDLKMPGSSGFEVLEWVRDQPGLKRLLVVILTASSDRRDVNRAYDLGANSFLVKPVGFRDLVKLVEELRRYWLEANRAPNCET